MLFLVYRPKSCPIVCNIGIFWFNHILCTVDLCTCGEISTTVSALACLFNATLFTFYMVVTIMPLHSRLSIFMQGRVPFLEISLVLLCLHVLLCSTLKMLNSQSIYLSICKLILIWVTCLLKKNFEVRAQICLKIYVRHSFGPVIILRGYDFFSRSSLKYWFFCTQFHWKRTRHEYVR